MAVDRYIYVIGGRVQKHRVKLTECARFDTEQNEWEKIAPLNMARENGFGACKNEKIFITGGMISSAGLQHQACCEVYNILTDEWQFIASLNGVG